MIKIKNVMEDIVFTELDLVLERLNCCKCERCKADIATLALNSLPPKYADTRRGEVLSRSSELSREDSIRVLSHIASAAQKISANPHHDLVDDEI